MSYGVLDGGAGLLQALFAIASLGARCQGHHSSIHRWTRSVRGSGIAGGNARTPALGVRAHEGAPGQGAAAGVAQRCSCWYWTNPSGRGSDLAVLQEQAHRAWLRVHSYPGHSDGSIRSPSGGWRPTSRSAARRSWVRSRFSSNASTVARPIAVRPRIESLSRDQIKCSAHWSCLRWNKRTDAPVSGSTILLAVGFPPITRETRQGQVVHSTGAFLR